MKQLNFSSTEYGRRWRPEERGVLKKSVGVNADQVASIGAMISYIASKSGQSEFRIERNLADHFNVPNAKLLSAQDFDNAIQYLTEILPSNRAGM